MKHLVLVGGGHGHLFVLKELAKKSHLPLSITLINPNSVQAYSGMLPGVMAGHYSHAEHLIDLAALARKAGVEFICQPIVGMDANKRYVCLSDGNYIHYDLLSINIGSETQCKGLTSLNNTLLTIKPLLDFQRQWNLFLETTKTKTCTLVVIGAGPAGFEIALAASYRLNSTNITADIILIGGNTGLISNFTEKARAMAHQQLQQNNIKFIAMHAVSDHHGLVLSNGQQLHADLVIATTGARAQTWLTHSQLALDSNGFIAVDAFHRSLSHHTIFAIGDVCARSDVHLVKSGVNAVRAGPIIARNIIAALEDKPLKKFMPKKNNLYILACGRRYAILCWGTLCIQGTWLWRLKNYIDKKFIRKFSV